MPEWMAVSAVESLVNGKQTFFHRNILWDSTCFGIEVLSHTRLIVQKEYSTKTAAD